MLKKSKKRQQKGKNGQKYTKNWEVFTIFEKGALMNATIALMKGLAYTLLKV